MQHNNIKKISVAVIGGGMTGISAAITLAKTERLNVTLLESADHLGGLSDFYTWNGMTWDRFYHVVLSTDAVTIDFIREIGLEGELFWKDTRSGFYGEGKLVSMSTPLDFLKFPFLSLWQKFRLGVGILYSSRIKEPTKLDRIYVRQWLTSVFGRRVYERIWDPLLRSKLGSAREKTSAAFIWATICRLYGARSADNKQEQMGHVHGGYRRILEAAEQKLKELGVRIVTNARIESVAKAADPDEVALVYDRHQHHFDKTLLTVNCSEALRILGNPAGHPYWDNLSQVQYLGVICIFVVLKRRLSPYYVINLLDTSLPFTGIIEATNIVDPGELQGHHLVFLPKYVPPDDPLVALDDAAITRLFIAGLKQVYSDLADSDILHTRVFREPFVQPLQEVDYLKRLGGFATPIDNVYLVNTSMIYNSTLNNNAAITLANQAANAIIYDPG